MPSINNSTPPAPKHQIDGSSLIPGVGGRGREHLCNGIRGICCWMGSHFHDLTDYNGVAFFGIFSRVPRMAGVALFRDFDSKKIISLKVTKMKSIIGHRIDQK